MAKLGYDDNYVMRKRRRTSPRRPGSQGDENWKQCYRDGITLHEYLHQKFKPTPVRYPIRHKKFIGPRSDHFYWDLRHGYIEMVRR